MRHFTPTLITRLVGYLVFLWAIAAAVTGCASWQEYDDTKEWSAQRLYEEAKQQRLAGNYKKAIELYRKLEARYPFGRHAQQAQIETVYTFYKFEEPALAIAAADRFIKIYPRHPNVDYAYYIKGIIHFNLGRGFFSDYLPIDPSRRDPGAASQAFQDFGELIRRFPDSKYAEDARQRMVYLRNNLAKHEIHVANYYIRRGAYIAAANRGKYVVQNYQGTSSVADALVIMAKAYNLLKAEELSVEALRVLELNFPNHPGIAEVKEMQITD